MRKILVMLICCGMFQLFASRTGEGGANFLDPDLYTKTQKRSGGYLVTYNEDFYDLQTQEVLEADEEGYFRTAYEYIMDGETKLFLSRVVTDLISVDRKPVTQEGLLNSVWFVQDSITRTVNHHMPAGGRTLTQFELKQGFNIFHYNYALTIRRVFGLENGEEKELLCDVSSKAIQRVGQLTGKKGKDTWYNDPAGQGSNGFAPQNASEEEAEFRKWFPGYAHLI